jgi:hypothetical protein
MRLAAISFAILITAGCAECSDDCGSGVHVWWQRDDLPFAKTYVLCVNGSCEQRPVEQIDGHPSVAPSQAPGLKVQVELRLLDTDKRVLRRYRGGGTRTGHCCPSIYLHALPSGELVKASP